jgi:hypothetical protein
MGELESYWSCSIDHGTSWLRSTRIRIVNSQEYRESMLLVCRLIREQHVSHWLYNTGKFYSLTLSDQVWLREVLFPLLKETGLRKLAIVAPEDVFLQTVADRLCWQSKPIFRGGIRMEAFFDAESAEEWLLSSG